MPIERVHIDEFMAHRNVGFDFGKRVNIITGPNGSGKSTILGAIIWALWGSADRLETGEAASVTLNFDGRTLVRSTTKQLQQTSLDGKASVGKARADEELNPLFGTYAAWSRALYITGKKVSAFTSATARAKLQHLESITGVSRINKGYEIANELAKTEKLASQSVESKLAGCNNAIENRKAKYHAGVRTSEETLKLGDNVSDIEQKIADTQNVLRQIEGALERSKPRIEEVRRAAREAKDAYNEAYHSMLAEEKAAAVCPVCGTGKLFDRAQAQEVLSTLSGELRDFELAERTELAHVQNYHAQSNSLRSHTRTLESALQRALSVDELYERQQCVAYADLIELFNQRAERVKLEQEAVKASQRAYVASIVEETLHPTAVRKSYLSSFTKTIETAANRYLTAMNVKYKVRISLSESSVDITVEGLAKPSLEAASSGEQRRIDIAIMLGMADVGAYVGTVPSNAPFIIDEAFDTLDTSGVQALVDLAVEISKTRQVFLVSHGAPSLPAHPDINHTQL